MSKDRGWAVVIWYICGYIHLVAKVKSRKSNPHQNLPSSEQLPRAQIAKKLKKFSAHHIANVKSIMLSLENGPCYRSLKEILRQNCPSKIDGYPL